MLTRLRGALQPQSNGLVCAIDEASQGTWFAVNPETRKFGWLTNFEHKPFREIHDSKHRRGPLLVKSLTSENGLETFLKEGQEFNGVNLALGNCDELKFVTNDTSHTVSHLDLTTMQSFSNGSLGDDWGKERLGRELCSKVLL